MVKNIAKNPEMPYFRAFAGFYNVFKSGKKTVEKW